MLTRQALKPIHKLAAEDICHDWVVFFLIVVLPLLALFGGAQFIEVHFFVFWFWSHSIQLIVHSVNQETHELLGVLLSEAWELRRSTGELVFEFARSNCATCLTRDLQELHEWICQGCCSQLLLFWKRIQDVVVKVWRGHYTLQDAVHKASVTYISKSNRLMEGTFVHRAQIRDIRWRCLLVTLK